MFSSPPFAPLITRCRTNAHPAPIPAPIDAIGRMRAATGACAALGYCKLMTVAIADVIPLEALALDAGFRGYDEKNLGLHTLLPASRRHPALRYFLLAYRELAAGPYVV